MTVMKMKTASGLEYEDIKKGDGPVPEEGQMVCVHYEVALSLKDLDAGNYIDSSYARKEPLRFRVGLGEALLGVDEGVKSMKVGDLRRLIVPPQLAFGGRGIKGIVPPNSTLFIDIKLSNIEL